MKHTLKNRVLKNNTFKQSMMKGGALCYSDMKQFTKKLFEFVDAEKEQKFADTYLCFQRNEQTETATSTYQSYQESRKYDHNAVIEARRTLFKAKNPAGDGRTLAHIAAIRGNLPILKFLKKTFEKELQEEDKTAIGYPTFKDYLDVKNAAGYTAFEELYTMGKSRSNAYVNINYRLGWHDPRDGRNLHTVEQWFKTELGMQPTDKLQFDGDKLNYINALISAKDGDKRFLRPNMDLTNQTDITQGKYSFKDIGLPYDHEIATSKPIAGSAAAAVAASSTVASGTGCSIDATKQGELRTKYSNIPPNAVFICLEDGTPYVIVHGTNTYSLNFAAGAVASGASGSGIGAADTPEQTILDNLNGLITGSSDSDKENDLSGHDDDLEELEL